MTREEVLEECARMTMGCWNYYAEDKNPVPTAQVISALDEILPEFQHSEEHKAYEKAYNEMVVAEEADNE